MYETTSSGDYVRIQCFVSTCVRIREFAIGQVQAKEIMSEASASCVHLSEAGSSRLSVNTKSIPEGTSSVGLCPVSAPPSAPVNAGASAIEEVKQGVRDWAGTGSGDTVRSQ